MLIDFRTITEFNFLPFIRSDSFPHGLWSTKNRNDAYCSEIEKWSCELIRTLSLHLSIFCPYPFHTYIQVELESIRIMVTLKWPLLKNYPVLLRVYCLRMRPASTWHALEMGSINIEFIVEVLADKILEKQECPKCRPTRLTQPSNACVFEHERRNKQVAINAINGSRTVFYELDIRHTYVDEIKVRILSRAINYSGGVIRRNVLHTQTAPFFPFSMH